MEASEKAGIEPVREAILWAGVGVDITNGFASDEE